MGDWGRGLCFGIVYGAGKSGCMGGRVVHGVGMREREMGFRWGGRDRLSRSGGRG